MNQKGLDIWSNSPNLYHKEYVENSQENTSVDIGA